MEDSPPPQSDKGYQTISEYLAQIFWSFVLNLVAIVALAMLLVAVKYGLDWVVKNIFRTIA